MFFLPASHLVTVNGQGVQVHAYESVEALKEDAGRISPDGGTIGNTSVRWIAPPHFYTRGTFLVLYVGAEEDVLRVLQGALGTPIAGEGAPVVAPPLPRVDDDLPVVSPPLPRIDDGENRIASPTLIVAGTPDEVDVLTHFLHDKVRGEELASVDLESNWVVAVFRGQMPSAGYAIEIEHVSVDAEGVVVVEVSLENPPVDAMVAEVITHPVAVAVVPRTDAIDPASADWVALTDDGRALARLGRGTTWPGSDVLTPTDDEGAGTAEPLPEPDPLPLGKTDIRGSISEVEVYEEAGAAGVLARILVEGEQSPDTGYDRAWIDIVTDTQLSFDGESFAPPTLGDLAPGRAVQASFTGPVRESYPVQAVARQVIILR